MCDCKRFKDGETLTGNSDYVLSEDDVEHTFTLVLPSANETHAGTYTVKASNEHGFDESSVSFIQSTKSCHFYQFLTF